MLYDAAVAKNVVVAVEVHKRLDQMYTDARDRIQNLGLNCFTLILHIFPTLFNDPFFGYNI